MSKTNDTRPKTESLMVSAAFKDNGMVSVLLVGRPKPNGVPDIINAFEGLEADELWRRLNTVKNNPTA